MSHTLDFTKRKKQYLTVTLADEKNTVIMVGTPTKAVMDDLLILQASAETISESGNDFEALDELYAACARVMSRNKTGHKITKEYLEEIFDFEDVMVFFHAYIEFVSKISSAKN